MPLCDLAVTLLIHTPKFEILLHPSPYPKQIFLSANHIAIGRYLKLISISFSYEAHLRTAMHDIATFFIGVAEATTLNKRCVSLCI